MLINFLAIFTPCHIKPYTILQFLSLYSLGRDVDEVDAGAAVVVPAAQLVRLGQVRLQPQHGAVEAREGLAALELRDAAALRGDRVVKADRNRNVEHGCKGKFAL